MWKIGVNLTYLKPFKASDINLSLFRARSLNDFHDVNLIREHSYPPLNFTKIGRCNFPLKPVFYCSPDPKISLFEVSRQYPDKLKKYALSKWSIIKSDKNVIIQSFLNSELPDNNIFKDFSSDLKTNLSKPFEISLNKKLTKTQEKGLMELFNYLDSTFIDDENYSISASLAHQSLYAKHTYKTDILIYPSNQSKKIGVNFALNPNFVENNLQMDRIYIISLDFISDDFQNVDLTISQYGEVVNNIIIWKHIDKNDNRYHQIIKEDFGDFNHHSFNPTQ